MDSVTTSYKVRVTPYDAEAWRRLAYVHGRHDRLERLCIELKHSVEDANLVVAQGLVSLSMKLQEGLEFRLFVRVLLIRAEHGVEQACNRPSDGCE